MNTDGPARLSLKYILVFALFITGIIFSARCAGRAVETMSPAPLPDGLSMVEVPSELISGGRTVKNIPVDIFIPAGRKTYTGDILVLPGWNFSRKEWQKKTGLLESAKSNNLRLVFPEMGKTLYESRYFQETRMRWAAMPGGQWIRQMLIPALQKYGLFRPVGRNFILGLSTGGRGVALISLANPGLFTAGASLSGDFNQAAMPSDRLMQAVYGSISHYRERWISVDNPLNSIREWKMPMYLGHGKRDHVVPFDQTAKFHAALVKAHPDLRIEFHDPEKAGHDFTYWSSEVEPVIRFFLSTP